MDNEICWIVGVVDAYGAVHSRVLTLDDPNATESHFGLFGLHGVRFRADAEGKISSNTNLDPDTYFKIEDHVEKVLKDHVY